MQRKKRKKKTKNREKTPRTDAISNGWTSHTLTIVF